jgi:hypothetical protein
MTNPKTIQSRLSRKGVTFSLAQIREYLEQNGYPQSDLTDEQVTQIVDNLSPAGIIPATESASLTQQEKQNFIQEVASNLQINLSLDNVKEISQKLDWAFNDRTSLKAKIQQAIIAWIDFKAGQDKQQTDELIETTQQYFSQRMAESGEYFNTRATDFSKGLEESVHQFRATEDKFLELFKIPG